MLCGDNRLESEKVLLQYKKKPKTEVILALWYIEIQIILITLINNTHSES